MIKVGNILIDYDSVATVTRSFSRNERGVEIIQIVYKNGVVKNFLSNEIGMNYDQFTKELETIHSKESDKYLFKIMTMLQHGDTPS